MLRRLNPPCRTTNRLPALLISRRVARSLTESKPPSQSSTGTPVLRLGCSTANSLDYPINGACCSSSRPQRQFPSGVLFGEVHQCPVFGSCGWILVLAFERSEAAIFCIAADICVLQKEF